MHVTTGVEGPAWLLLLFSLPANRASERVGIWRKLQRFGTLPLRSGGHVLPNNAANQERLEWLAQTIRGHKGQASVVKVQGFDDLPDPRLRQLFVELRARDYERLLREVKKLVALTPGRRPAGKLSRLRLQLQEVAAIDFFDSPLRSSVETMLARADSPVAASTSGRKGKASEYHKRVWVTRPRPGIDRVSSAWLIRRFIDPEARFVFANDPAAQTGAIPFDMFQAEGFGHRGEDCTFETLCHEFAIRDARVRRIAQIIHDADLGDGKFGRVEGGGLDQVLNGWARQDVPDDELLRRGMELIEGLYAGTGKSQEVKP